MVFHHGREEVKQSQVWGAAKYGRVLLWGYYQVGRVIPWDTVKYCGQAVCATWFSRVCVCLWRDLMICSRVPAT